MQEPQTVNPIRPVEAEFNVQYSPMSLPGQGRASHTGFVGWGGAAIAVMGVVSAVNMLVNAFKLLIASETLAAVMAGDFSAIGRLTLGVGAVAGVIGGIDAMVNSGNKETMDSPANKMSQAADKMETTVNKMADAFDSLKGKGVPGGLSSVDNQTFYRYGALGAIG